MDIGTIQRRIGMILKFQEENKIAKDTLKQALDEDEPYHQANQELKEIAAKKKVLKDQIWAQPANKALLEDIKVNNDEVKTLQDILNHELLDFYQKNGSFEIEDALGNPIKFKLIAKLFPKGFIEQP